MGTLSPVRRGRGALGFLNSILVRKNNIHSSLKGCSMLAWYEFFYSHQNLLRGGNDNGRSDPDRSVDANPIEKNLLAAVFKKGMRKRERR